MKWLPYLLAPVILMSLAPLEAMATTIFDNGGPVAGAGDVIGDLAFSGGQQGADDFILSSAASVFSDEHWFGTRRSGNSPTTDDFAIRSYSDAAGPPVLLGFGAMGVAGRTRRAQ